jgi:uncharacterized membrane protein
MKKKVMMIHESTSTSWKRDASTWVLVVACLLPGWYLDMTMLSVVGIFVFAVVLFSKANGVSNDYTIEEAREFLDNLEGETK